MTTKRLTIQIDGRDGRLDTKSFVAVIQSTVECLNALRRHDDRATWIVESLQKRNPAVVELSGNADTIDEFMRTMAIIEKPEPPSVVPPMRFLVGVRKLARVLDNGVYSLQYSDGRSAVEPTLHAAQNARDAIGGKFYSVEMALDGRLDLISVKGDARRLRMSIHSDVFGRDVACIASPEMIEQSKDLFGKRVLADGTVRFRKDNDEPTRIIVRSIEPLDDDDTPLSNAIPIDLTNGLSSEEYVRRLRDE